MTKKLKDYYATLLETNPDVFMKELSFSIKSNKDDRVIELLSIIEKRDNRMSPIKLYREGDDETETLLHIAIKYEDNTGIIKKIIQLCPDLLAMARDSSINYKGQNPLHIAITKGREQLVELLLEEYSDKKQASFRERMIQTQATGLIFANTVMMGELPLSVAALTFNENVVDVLIEKGSMIYAQNSLGDTVMHSLVKYAAVYPDKTDKVITMLSYLDSKLREEHPSETKLKDQECVMIFQEDSCIWFLKNYDNFTPLQLSAKLGVVEVFQFIIKLEDVYSFVSTHDGLFDVKLYDITEIDTVANLKSRKTSSSREGKVGNKVSRNNIDGISRTSIKATTDCNPFSSLNYPETESILEMMFANDYQNSPAFRIIESSPVKNIILEKWKKIRKVYYLWGFFHLLMTICLTAEAVIRSNLFAVRSATNVTMLDISVSTASERFAEIASYFSFFGGILYLMIGILLIIAKIRRPNCYRYILHNSGYLFFLLTLSVCLWLDFFMTTSLKYHDNIALVIAIIMGWSFAVFFLRAIYLFGFFTEMIRRVIFGDLLRFAVIIMFMLFAFTAGIYVAFIGELSSVQNFDQYNNAVSGSFDSYGNAMLTMFRLMLGLDDIGVLSEARLPWLAITLYIIFALLTYVLLINSLIAMMSQTFAQVHENRYPLWRLQQLSVILFIEDLFCLACIRRIFDSPGEEKATRILNPVTKQSRDGYRFYFKIHSFEQTYASEEDKEAIKNSKKDEEGSRLDDTFRNTSEIMGSIGHSTGMYRFSVRRPASSANFLQIPDLNVGMYQPYGGSNSDLKRKKSTKKNKHLSRVVEEDKIERQYARKLGSEPDLIKYGKSPEVNRRRYNSENMHERDNRRSPRSIASGSSETNLTRSGPLTPVEVKMHIHDHSRACPERKEHVYRNGYSHVDIEPYPHSSA